MRRKLYLPGRDVICEKPFTSNIEEARESIQISKEKKAIILEAVNTRYLPNALKISKRIPFQYCRITTDILCVVIGFVFHVTVGIGTVITAFMMGPVIQWFNVHLSEPIRYGRKKES